MKLHFLKSFHRRSTSGFTIIETLVAITVLMIAVAGPLSVATKALNAAIYARDQMTGSYLAQESMEVIKNTRDNNITTAGATSAWLDYIGSSAGVAICTKTAPCDASSVDVAQVSFCPTADLGGCQLYKLANGYGHSVDTTPSIFKRYYYLTAPNSTSNCSPTVNTECRVIVVVSWNEGTIAYSISLSSELVQATR